MAKELSELEKILIEYIATTGKNIWYLAYTLTHDTKTEIKASVQTLCSRWKNSDIVIYYYNQCIDENTKRLQNLFSETREKITDCNESGINSNELKAKNATDFTDRKQFLEYLNTQVNTITDDKIRTDYLKMLSDLLRFKETGTAKDSDIMRFYTPITCNRCPLYQEKQVL